MTIANKIKPIDSKIEQNKAQYDLDREFAKNLLYHQEMLVSMSFWQGKTF